MVTIDYLQTVLDRYRELKTEPPVSAVSFTRAIRAKCLECSGDSWHEVRFCQCFDCALWGYRFGKNPNAARRKRPRELDPAEVYLEGQRQAVREGRADRWFATAIAEADQILSGSQNSTEKTAYLAGDDPEGCSDPSKLESDVRGDD